MILHERTVEHIWAEKDSAIYKHLGDCSGVQNLFGIASLHSSLPLSSFPLNNDEVADLRSTRII